MDHTSKEASYGRPKTASWRADEQPKCTAEANRKTDLSPAHDRID